MVTLTILGSATAPTVLHSLLRSHLELSLMRKRENLWFRFYFEGANLIIHSYFDDWRPSFLPDHHELVFVGVVQRHVSHFPPSYHHVGTGLLDGLHLGLHHVLLSLTEVHELLCVIYQHCALRDRYD